MPPQSAKQFPENKDCGIFRDEGSSSVGSVVLSLHWKNTREDKRKAFCRGLCNRGRRPRSLRSRGTNGNPTGLNARGEAGCNGGSGARGAVSVRGGEVWWEGTILSYRARVGLRVGKSAFEMGALEDRSGALKDQL